MFDSVQNLLASIFRAGWASQNNRLLFLSVPVFLFSTWDPSKNGCVFLGCCFIIFSLNLDYFSSQSAFFFLSRLSWSCASSVHKVGLCPPTCGDPETAAGWEEGGEQGRKERGGSTRRRRRGGVGRAFLPFASPLKSKNWRETQFLSRHSGACRHILLFTLTNQNVQKPSLLMSHLLRRKLILLLFCAENDDNIEENGIKMSSGYCSGCVWLRSSAEGVSVDNHGPVQIYSWRKRRWSLCCPARLTNAVSPHRKSIVSFQFAACLLLGCTSLVTTFFLLFPSLCTVYLCVFNQQECASLNGRQDERGQHQNNLPFLLGLLLGEMGDTWGQQDSVSHRTTHISWQRNSEAIFML